MTTKYFEFHIPVKILSGKKALENLPFELSLLGSKRPLFLTDKGVRKAGLVKTVQKACSDSEIIISSIFDEIPTDSSTEVIVKIAEMYKEYKSDSLVAIGGGSVIDTAKAANILVSKDSKDLMDFAGADMLKEPLKPLVVIPTTAGTGSEASKAAIIKDNERNVKLGFVSQYLIPNLAILDPRMTLTLPKKVTAATAMDALVHAIEAYTCLQKNPISDSFAFEAVELISENIFDVLKYTNDKDKRLILSNAALLAGIAFSNSMVGLVHSLGHAVGAVSNIPHGVAMSIFLPHVLEYNFEKIEMYLAKLLLALIGPDEYSKTPKELRASKFIQKIRVLKDKLYKLTELPRTLEEADVSIEDFDEIAKKTLNDGSLIVNPKDVDYEGTLALLKKAYYEK